MKHKLIKIIGAVSVFTLVACGGGNKDHDEAERKKQSTAHVNDFYDENQLFHDQAEYYMSPLEPKSIDDVTVRVKCRYGQSVSASVWFTNDTVNPVFKEVPMSFEIADYNMAYEYWIGKIPAQQKVTYYHFSFTNKKETIYFNNSGLSEEQLNTIGGDWTIYPDFTTPDWSKGTIWYSIMPDSFSNGNTLNDKTGQHGDAWGDYHNGGNQYFGGDLAGVNQKLDYIKSFGAKSIFLNPIWNTTHQAGYGAFDFKQIDSCFGNEETLHTLIDELHKDDMNIMLDAVFEYCNVSNILYNSSHLYPDLMEAPSTNPDSEYYDFVQRDFGGNPIYSTWGSPLIDFSSEITRQYIYQNMDSVMQYYIREFGIDGWRMDVGNSLRGTDPDNFGTSTQILKDMRKYLKQVDNDFFFLSEHADGDQFNYCLDSKWNYSFGYAIRDWGKGVSNPMVLLNTIENGVLGLPRSVANSSYNFLTTHDLNRFYDIINTSKFQNADRDSIFNAANLLQFTFVGSPSIFYGEEVGMGGSHAIDNTIASPFFNSFDWNQENWNQNIMNRTKALGALRNSFNRLFKDGAYIRLYSKTGNENPNGLMSFGRFNSEGQAITVVNPTNNVQKGFTINVDLMDIKNGTTLYDYMTGKSYVVNDNKVTVDVYSGGIVLVSKKIESNVRGNLSNAVINNGTYDVTLGDTNAIYSIKGNGSIEEKKDSIGFTYCEGFNNYEIQAKVDSSNGTSALMIRSSLDDDASLYGVRFTKDGAKVIYRASNGKDISYGKSLNISSSDLVAISRNSNNQCSVSVNGVVVDTVQVNLPYNIYLGFASLSGTNTVILQDICALDKEFSNDFTSTLGSMLYADGDYAIENSYLILKGSSLKPAYVVMPHSVKDFSVKTSLDFVPSNAGEFAGISIGNDNDRILVCRDFENGNNLLLKRVINNGESIISTYQGASDQEVTLQLEKVGYNIYAYVKVGTHFSLIGQMQVNYSELDVKLVSNNGDARFDYICLGDSISGVNSEADFVGEDNVDFSVVGHGGAMAYDVKKGTWEFSNGGISQTDIEITESRYTYTAFELDTFSASFALNPKFANDNSYVGVVYGTSTSTSSRGFGMKLYRDGFINFFDNNDEIKGTYQIKDFKENRDYSFAIQVIDNVASFYIGEEPLLMFSSDNFATKGFFNFIGCESTYQVKTYGIYNDNNNYKIQTGGLNVYQNDKYPRNKDLEVVSNASQPGFVSLADTKVSNFIFSSNIQIMRTNKISRAYTRFYIGNRYGGNSLKEGLIIQISDEGNLTILEDGEETVTNKKLSLVTTESFYLVAVYQGTKLTIYTANYKEDQQYSSFDLTKELEYEDSLHRSGCFSLYSQNAATKYANIRCESLTKTQDYTNSKLMNDFFVEEPLPGEPEINPAIRTEVYSNDFSERQSIGDFTRYSGSVSIKGGNMIVDGTAGTNWDAGAGLAVGQFDNYKLECKVKNQNAYGWSAIEFNKAAVNMNHQQSSLTLLMTQTSAELYLGNDIYYTRDGSRIEINVVPDASGFIPVTIICNHGKLSLNCGNPNSTLVVNIEDLERNNNLLSGYVSLNSGANLVYFDDLCITPGEFEIKGEIKGNKELLKDPYNNDFSNEDSLKDFSCYNGIISIVDGALCLDAGTIENWKAGILFNKASLKEFDMDIDVKVEDNWGAIELFKPSETGDHEGKAITIMVSTSSVSLYLGQSIFQPGCEFNYTPDEDGYVHLHISVRSGVLTVGDGTNEFSVALEDLLRNNDLESGFMSLNSGNTKVYFDNIVINP